MTTLEITLAAVAVFEFFVIVGYGIFKMKKYKSRQIVKEKEGVRYTISDDVTDKEGNVNATFTKKDVILIADEVYTVNKKGPVKPGRYNILSPQGIKGKVTLKINGIGRNQVHNSGIVFAEGDIIIAPHESVILR